MGWRRFSGTLAVAASLAALGCRGPSGERGVAGTPSTTQRPSNVLLVTIDTLRADRIGVGVTPTLDALASHGMRFTHARTVAPLTLPVA